MAYRSGYYAMDGKFQETKRDGSRKNSTMSNYSGNRGPRISNDRFGNPYQLKLAETVVNKKSGEVINNNFATYFELGGKLYKVEVSPAQKEGKRGNGGVWIKVTQRKAQSRPQSM